METLTVEDIRNNAKNFEAGLSKIDTEILYNTAKSLKGKGCVVEVGSWGGFSISQMCAGLIEAGLNCKVFSIDPFVTSKDEPNGMYEKFIENLKSNGIFDRVTHIKEKSQIAGKIFNEPIELAFIDGFHRYDVVKQDYENFYSKVVKDGYIAFHDVGIYWGPTKLMAEIVENDGTFKVLHLTDCMLLAQKKENLSEQEKAYNKEILNRLEQMLVEKSETLLQ